jgi:hypothetical protein
MLQDGSEFIHPITINSHLKEMARQASNFREVSLEIKCNTPIEEIHANNPGPWVFFPHTFPDYFEGFQSLRKVTAIYPPRSGTYTMPNL